MDAVYSGVECRLLKVLNRLNGLTSRVILFQSSSCCPHVLYWCFVAPAICLFVLSMLCTLWNKQTVKTLFISKDYIKSIFSITFGRASLFASFFTTFVFWQLMSTTSDGKSFANRNQYFQWPKFINYIYIFLL